MFHKKTDDILVSVMPAYIDDRSKPEKNEYFWAYRVTIKNGGSESIQILRRHWQITDGNGNVETVDGDGIVGETPIIEVGEHFEYTSGCPLSTDSGIMVGHYEARRADGEMIEIAIPAFSLDLPNNKPIYN